MSNNTQGFGKPKFGGGGTFAKSIRLKENSTTVVRILPPMKSLSETGEWAVYVGTHFGYKGVNPKDRSKPTYRPFKCIEKRDYKTKMILQDCPECDLIAQRENELEDLLSNAKAQGHGADEIEELAKPLKDWLKDHNCDRKWHMNVKQQDGSFAVLQLSHKTKKLLESEITRVLTEDGIEALDLDAGVWFRFSRTGKGIETQDTVGVEYESVRDASTGRLIRTVKMAPLTEAEQEKALKECPDLATNVRSLSYEQIKLLTECSGEDEDVDKILALGEKKQESSPPATTKASAAPVSKPQPKPQPAPAPSASEEDEEAAALAALEAIKARKAAAKAVAQQAAAAANEDTESAPASKSTVAPTPASTPAAGLPVDRAAFMARFGSKKAKEKESA